MYSGAGSQKISQYDSWHEAGHPRRSTGSSPWQSRSAVHGAVQRPATQLSLDSHSFSPSHGSVNNRGRGSGAQPASASAEEMLAITIHAEMKLRISSSCRVDRNL